MNCQTTAAAACEGTARLAREQIGLYASCRERFHEAQGYGSNSEGVHGTIRRRRERPGQSVFTGGATALLLGFREQTIDIDLKMDPEPEGAFEAIAALKDRLNINVELAGPDDFIPPSPHWREQSRSIDRIGSVEFFH